MSREELLEYVCYTNFTTECSACGGRFNCQDCKDAINPLLDEYEQQIRADAIEQFKPFFKILMEYDNLEWICDEICGEFVNPQTDEPWCFENCKDMNFECVKKWLELKEQSNG